MKTYPEMDKEIVKLLDMEGMPLSVYAARVIENLQAENAALRERLNKAVELPFFQKDGEVIVLIYKDKDGLVLIEEYIEDEYYNGKRGKETAEARFKELKEEI